jgi:UDP-N-acetylmuramoyl-L-alanyl-D-glutamate--2,6-diaminopimelate ligase
MISLRELVSQACPEARLSSIPDLSVRGVECDSRKVEKDFLFVAIAGVNHDGNEFIRQALQRGALAVVTDKKDLEPSGGPFILVPECRAAIANLASAFYRHPSRKLKMIGITGTNGKTTCSFLIEHILKNQGQKPGVLGTVHYRFGDKTIPALETTPGPLRIQNILSQMVEAGCGWAVMEVSSHALDQKRIQGIDFSAALFTNLTQDHLDYHKTIEVYFETKSRLFLELSKEACAALNADDERVAGLEKKIGAQVMTYGIKKPCDLRAANIEWHPGHTHFDLFWKDQKLKVQLPMVGLHNVYNALGSLAVAVSLGMDLAKACRSLKDFEGAPGRLEAVQAGQDFSVLIDFAHTPDGLENVLSSLEPYRKKRLLVVFGCGGDRDKTKRPLMGRIAAERSDFVYVTSDNPRSEDPKEIAKDVCAGFPADFKNFSVVIDRRKAIRQALLSARSGDIVLLAGKGHETSQVIGTQKFPFSDHQEAQKVLCGR